MVGSKRGDRQGPSALDIEDSTFYIMGSMVIRLSEIEDEAQFVGSLSVQDLKSLYENLDFITPVEYSLKVQKSGKAIRVSGRIHGELRLTCARCLENFVYVIDSDLKLELVSRDLAPSVPELELSKDELDIHYYEKDEIEVSEIVGEELILNIPMRALCKEECQGLCEICGGNKNRGECRCEVRTQTRLGELLKIYLEGEGDGGTKEKAVKIKKG